MNPLEDFKKPLIKEFTLGNHKVKLRTLNSKEFEIISEKSNNIALNKINILSKSLISVDDVDIKNFDSVKEEVNNNSDIDKAIVKEIESWDSVTTDILYNYFNLLMKEKSGKSKKEINFKTNPELRIYWKLRRYFSEEEIDNWSTEDWDWAVKNLHQDEEDKIDLIKNVFNFIKPYMNIDLYKAEKDIEEKEKAQKAKDDKFISQFNTEKAQFSINSNGGDVFSDTIEFEEVSDDETPLILEE